MGNLSPRGKPRHFLTIPDVADELGLSERSVWRKISEGQLPVHHFGAATRISREDLDDYAARSRRCRSSVKKGPG